VPTASADDLDAEVILVESGATIGEPAGQVTVAAANVGHLARCRDGQTCATFT